MRDERATSRTAIHGRKAARGAATLFVAQFTLVLSSYVVALALARALGPELYGAYGIVYSFLLSIELIGRLGLPQAMTKLIADQRTGAPRLEATGFTLAAIVCATIFAGFWLAAPALGALFHVADGARLFRIAAIDIPFYGVYFMLTNILTGRRLFHATGLGTIVYGLSKAAGILVLVQIGPSIAGALLVNALGSIVALAVVLPYVGRAPFRLTVAERRPIIRLAVPVALISLGTQTVISIDLWVLNAVGTGVDDAIKGLYVAAVNVARIPNFVAFVASAVLVPTIAASLATHDQEAMRAYLGGALRFLAIVLLPGCTLIAINAAEVLALLFSADYAAGADLLVVLIFAHGLCFTIFLSLAYGLVGAGRATTSACLALGALAVAAALSVTLVLLAGALGAAWAALIANAAGLAAAIVVINKTLGVPLDASSLARVLSLTAVLAALSWWLEESGSMLLVEFALLGMLYLDCSAAPTSSRSCPHGRGAPASEVSISSRRPTPGGHRRVVGSGCADALGSSNGKMLIGVTRRVWSERWLPKDVRNSTVGLRLCQTVEATRAGRKVTRTPTPEGAAILVCPVRRDTRGP